MSQAPLAAGARVLLEPGRIRAITLDLDDTLWPVWPTIARAEKALHGWLAQRAPATAALYGSPVALREIREAMNTLRPDLRHDMSALRRESIRLALQRAGDDPALAEAAFEVFFDERQRVELYEDALPALEFLSKRFPLVAVSNGNASVHRTGIGAYFRGAFSAHEFGIAKPDARIFHAAAQAAGVESGAVLHVGDDAELDVIGALGAGMQTFWLTRDDKPWAHPHPHAPHHSGSSLAHLTQVLG
jgi:putative hydrolase of the HAD superfamily